MKTLTVGFSLRQIPKLHKELVKLGILKQGTVNLDIGGGAFNDGTRFLERAGVRNLVLDPWGRPAAENLETLEEVGRLGGVDTVTMSNVLNVIPYQAERNFVLRMARAALKPGGRAYINVYEGRGTGRGRSTKKGWQEHRKLRSYIPEIQKVFRGIRRIRGDILEAA